MDCLYLANLEDHLKRDSYLSNNGQSLSLFRCRLISGVNNKAML